MPKKTSQTIYLDYAAATPMDRHVLDAMQPYFTDKFYNPSATYMAGRNVKQDLDEARSKIAHWLGARPSEIIFTAGGTEANNIAVHGVMQNHPKANLVISAVEHDSVLHPASEYDYRVANVSKQGRIDVDNLVSKIDDQTVLVCVMQANNEIGTIQPIKDISEVIHKIRNERLKKGNKLPLLLHSDSTQAANYLDLHVARLGVDLLSINGGKIYGPKQSGVLYVKGGISLKSTILGGNQEQGLRSGTQNVPAAIGLATALDIAQNKRNYEAKRLQKIQKLFIDELLKIPGAIINGSLKTRLPNNVHLTLPGIDNETLLIQLDEAGIMAAAGSACSASSEEPSKVLRAIGLDKAEIQSSIRFTMGRRTTELEIKKTLQILLGLVS